MNPKEIIERCNDMIKRLAHAAYGEQNLEAIKDIEALDEVISVLEKQEQDRWIPITEKLPKPYKTVIVTDIETIDTYTSEYHGCGYWGTDTGDAKNRIIAWQSLPNPYTEEYNDKP